GRPRCRRWFLFSNISHFVVQNHWFFHTTLPPFFVYITNNHRQALQKIAFCHIVEERYFCRLSRPAGPRPQGAGPLNSFPSTCPSRSGRPTSAALPFSTPSGTRGCGGGRPFSSPSWGCRPSCATP